jgi:phage-related protein
MADQSYAEFINAFAKANVPLKKHTKGIQLMAIKYKLLEKAFGPFLDIFLSVKQVGQVVGESFEALNKPTEELTENMENLDSVLGGVGGGFKMIMTSLILMVGIVMAIVGVIFLMAGSFGEMDSIMPGITDRIGVLLGVFEGLKDSVMNLISTIGGLDFAPIVQGIGIVIGVIFQLSTAALAVVGTILAGFFDLLAAIYGSGLGQALIDSIGMILGSFTVFFDTLKSILGDSEMTFEDVISAIEEGIDVFINFLMTSGIFDFFADVALAIGETVQFVMKALGVIVAVLVAWFAIIGPFVMPFYKALLNGIEIVLAIVIGAFQIVLAGFRGIVALLSGDIDGFLEHCQSIIDIFDDIVTKVAGLFEDMFENVMEFLDPILEGVGKVVDGIGGFVSGGLGLLGFSEGGIAKGPTSGYPVALHGTEAIVPLPNGRSIPVEMKGAMTQPRGGDNITLNISVTGGGNANEIAKKVSEEVARTFRNRSRGSGFTRGI